MDESIRMHPLAEHRPELKYLKPEGEHRYELETDEGPIPYRYELYSATTQKGEEVATMRLVDEEMGFAITIPLWSRHRRAIAEVAYGAMKHSRSDLEGIQLHDSSLNPKVDSDKRAGEVAKYGHSSIMDGVSLGFHLENCSMYGPLALFNEGTFVKGTEKSSRFIKLDPTGLETILNQLPNLSESIRASIVEGYERLGGISMESYEKFNILIHSALEEVLPPDPTNPEHAETLRIRTLDAARSYLLMSVITGGFFNATAREVSRIIGVLKASPMKSLRRIGHLLEMGYAPPLEVEDALDFKADCPTLIRYTKVNETVRNNIRDMRVFLETETDLLAKVPPNEEFKDTPSELESGWLLDQLNPGEKAIRQYILQEWPGMDKDRLTYWILSQEYEVLDQIAVILYQSHNQHNPMPQMASTTAMSLEFDTSIADIRDLNRHTGYPDREIVGMPFIHASKVDRSTINQVLSKGFIIPPYLRYIDTPAMQEVRERFVEDMQKYYQELRNYVDMVEGMLFEQGIVDIDYSFVFYLLPLSHRMTIMMEGVPKQIAYLFSIRGAQTGPGAIAGVHELVNEARLKIPGAFTGRRDPFLMQEYKRAIPRDEYKEKVILNREVFYKRS